MIFGYFGDDLLSLVGGLNPSEKYEFVRWDDYSQSMEKHVPNHQPDISLTIINHY